MKNWVKRALRTFLQAAVGYAVVALPSINWQEEGTVLRGTLIGVGVSAIAAGLSAAMNFIEDNKLL